MSNKPQETGRIRSFQYAISGLRIMLKSQKNAWIHAVATVIVLLLGFYFRIKTADWCWIILAVTAVWTAEALNTALEFLTDVASPEFHPVAEKAKNVAAGAVLITAIAAIAIGAIVFFPYVFRLIFS